MICLYSDVSLREINYLSGLRENGLNSSIPQEAGAFPESSVAEIVINHNDIYYWGGNVKRLLGKKSADYRVNLPNLMAYLIPRYHPPTALQRMAV
jgi:hypothetical protein